MNMHSNAYLTTDEAADYLRIKERKLYELVANGDIPCSKVTGKWLFPRTALDRWVEAGLACPPGLAQVSPPAIIGGSNDPLLEWAARRSGSGLALLSEGSEAGLMRLARDEVMLAAIHMHGGGDNDERANIEAVRGHAALHDVVLIHLFRREQGLLVAPGNPLALRDLNHARAAKARFGLRQKGAGAQLLLERLLSRIGGAPADLVSALNPFATGQDLALAIRNSDVDCGVATRAVAATHGLDFLSLVWESFDLALRRRAYFGKEVQAFMAFTRSEEFVRQATHFSGYDLAATGTVRLNR
ncbi:MAG: substrate-binding domain-containing protein [Beijerinckiaceae bacterium]